MLWEDIMKKYFLLTSICIIIISLIGANTPVVATETDYYPNSFILVVGACNTVDRPLMWGLGIYIPILRKNFYIATNNQEGEMISIIVKNDQNAFLLSLENASIRMNGARGIYYWAGGSPIIQNSSFIMILGRAKDIWITH